MKLKGALKRLKLSATGSGIYGTNSEEFSRNVQILSRETTFFPYYKSEHGCFTPCILVGSLVNGYLVSPNGRRLIV